MKDETYSFIQDVKEKGTVARSSHNRRSHTGRGGKVRFPSDNLSKKELKKMSGECVSYRLNEPMTWAEFKKMPDDIKVTYIKLLQEKWKVPVNHIGKMMGVSQPVIQRETARLGIVLGKGVHKQTWDKEGFYAWVNGVPTTVPEEDAKEEKVVWVKPEPVKQEEEPEAFMEDDLPFEDSAEENVGDNRILLPSPFLASTTSQHHAIPQTACPNTGSLSFKCPASMALNTLKELLQNEMVAINITWRVVEEGGDDNG